jgi:hypothetical protein
VWGNGTIFFFVSKEDFGNNYQIKNPSLLDPAILLLIIHLTD